MLTSPRELRASVRARRRALRALEEEERAAGRAGRRCRRAGTCARRRARSPGGDHAAEHARRAALRRAGVAALRAIEAALDHAEPRHHLGPARDEVRRRGPLRATAMKCGSSVAKTARPDRAADLPQQRVEPGGVGQPVARDAGERHRRQRHEEPAKPSPGSMSATMTVARARSRACSGSSGTALSENSTTPKATRMRGETLL